MKKLKSVLKAIKIVPKTLNKVIKSTIEEIFILIGLSLIVYATYLINVVAALYVAGTVLFLFGLFLAMTKTVSKRGD